MKTLTPEEAEALLAEAEARMKHLPYEVMEIGASREDDEARRRWRKEWEMQVGAWLRMVPRLSDGTFIGIEHSQILAKIADAIERGEATK